MWYNEGKPKLQKLGLILNFRERNYFVVKQFENRLYLRAFEYEDLPFINKLRNDDSLFALTCGTKFFISSERDKKWIEDKIFNNYYQLYLMIVQREDNKPVGYIMATNIDYVHRKAQLGGIVITEELSGKGYGTESSFLFLRHLFYELGMNMVYTHVREDHAASLKLFEKLGFQKDGLIRSYIYKQNKFHNVFIVTLLKNEFDNNMEIQVILK